MTREELLFDRKVALLEGERELCLKCARKAMRRLRRSRRLDWLFAPLRTYDLMWLLSSYALFLREVAAGRRIRYRKLTEIAVAGAAVMGDRAVLHLLERNGVVIESVRWSCGKLSPFALAAMADQDELAEELLTKYPGMLDASDVERNLKVCVCHGSTAFVERLLTRVGKMFECEHERWLEFLSAALFSAVACDRRETTSLVMRLGADGARAVTDGQFPAHLESSLFSCAIDQKNFEFADVCLARRWIPGEEQIWELPNTANALENLDKFKYLCRAFPKEDFPADVIDYWSRHYDVSSEVYAFCGGEGKPQREGTRDDVEDCTDAEIMADFGLLRDAVARNPDRLFDFDQIDHRRVQEFFSSPQTVEWGFLPAYVFRKAKVLGIDLFGGKEAERRFVESIPGWQSHLYRPHLVELGWHEYCLKEPPAVRDHSVSEAERRYERAAKARGKELAAFLDDPTFDPNAAPYGNWSFAQSVCCRGTPKTFRAWALRGMDTYGQNCEGNYAIDGAKMPKWRSLVTVFGMDPLHRAYDGSSALGVAIAHHEDETAKWLWLHGNRGEWEGCSPLRMSLLNWNDELSGWFKSQGEKNVDSTGREYPLPPWVE